MQEFGGFEAGAPSEGSFKAPEQLSEAAKQRFAAAQQQIKVILKEEKRARKRDDSVAKTIMQFLGDDRYAHLFPLISKLAARDCPSVFILAILSLIHEPSRQAVEEYAKENKLSIAILDIMQKATGQSGSEAGVALFGKDASLPEEVEEKLVEWISRMQLVLSIDGKKTLLKLMVDESSIDGTALELMTTVLVDFFNGINRPVDAISLKPLTTNIFQTIVEPFAEEVEQHFRSLREAKEKEQED